MIKLIFFVLSMSILGLATSQTNYDESRPVNLPNFQDIFQNFYNNRQSQDGSVPSNLPSFWNFLRPGENSGKNPPFNFPNFRSVENAEAKFFPPFVSYWCRSSNPRLNRFCQTRTCATGNNIGGYCEQGECICVTRSDILPTTTTTVAPTTTTVAPTTIPVEPTTTTVAPTTIPVEPTTTTAAPTTV